MEPVRKIVRRSGLGTRGHFSSYKNGRSVAFESHRERRCACLLEYSPGALEFVEQPITLHYSDDDGKARRATPDYGAKLRNGSRLLVEVKDKERLKDPHTRARLARIATAANREGYIYKVVSDEILLDSVAIRNVDSLLYARPPRHEVARYQAILQGTSIDGMTIARASLEITRHDVMRMLALQLIRTDLRVPISDSSVVHLPGRDDDDLLIG